MSTPPNDLCSIDEAHSMTRSDQEFTLSNHKLLHTIAQLESRNQDINAHQSAIQSRIEMVREELSRLEEKDKELDLKKQQYLRTISAIRSLNAPWRHLPRDVMEVIFILCLPLQEDQCPSINHAPFLLMRVCWSWCRLAQDIPRLWTTIMLTSDKRSSLQAAAVASGTRYLDLCINRSREAPIRLYVRTEFLADYASFRLITQICHQISHISLTYPEDCTFGHHNHFGSDQFTVLNMKSFEVHHLSPGHSAIPDLDLHHLGKIVNSSAILKSFTFCTRQRLQNHPLLVDNWSILEILHLMNPITLSFCLTVLQNAPALRQLSFTQLHEKEGSELDLSEIRDLSHPNLHTLAITHIGTGIALAVLFRIISAPNLQNLVVSRSQSPNMDNSEWPHDQFVIFLQRCQLKHLELSFEPIELSQYLEILRLPACNTIESLTLWRHSGDRSTLADASFWEALTLRSCNQERCETTEQNFMRVGVCPTLQILELNFMVQDDDIDNFLGMIKSRLPSQRLTTSACPAQPLPDALKIFHGLNYHWNEAVREELNSLYPKRLVVVENDPAIGSLPVSESQHQLLGTFVAEGFDLRVFDPYHGKWVHEADRLMGDLGDIPTSHDCSYCSIPLL